MISLSELQRPTLEEGRDVSLLYEQDQAGKGIVIAADVELSIFASSWARISSAPQSRSGCTEHIRASQDKTVLVKKNRL